VADARQAHQSRAVAGDLQDAEIDDRVVERRGNLAGNEGQIRRAGRVRRPGNGARQRQIGPEPPAGSIEIAFIGQETALSD
jgi:hypothetical protein